MNDLVQDLVDAGVILDGHFLLTSGRHSPRFFLLARAFERPSLGERLGRDLARRFEGDGVEAVVGPAMGGVILAYEVARHLPGARALFAEKTEDGRMALRRGFALRPHERVLVVEDAVTTGGSVQKVIEHVAAWDVEVVGVGAVVDRSGGAAAFGGLPFRSVLAMPVESWEPAHCPLCRQGVPLTRPKA
jgi:orotate phosphoribosyltransferase